MRTRFRLIALVLLLSLLLVGCGGTPAASPTAQPQTTVDLYLAFRPDVQFAPFYTGIEKGIFQQHGITINITHQSESDAMRLVGTESGGESLKAAVVSGEQVLLARAQDIPVVYVFEWYQKFPIAVASKTEKGIVTVNDLAGRSVGVPMLEGASYIGLRALLSAGGLSEIDIDQQATGFTQVETLINDRVDAVVVYASNEPIQLEAQNVPVNLIYVSDVVDIVSNGLVVNEDAVAQNPEVVRNLVAALSESLAYTIDHPDEAYEFSKKYVDGLADPAVEATQKEVLLRSIDLWRAQRLGLSDSASWIAMQDILLTMGLLTESQDIEAAYTNDYVP